MSMTPKGAKQTPTVKELLRASRRDTRTATVVLLALVIVEIAGMLKPTPEVVLYEVSEDQTIEVPPEPHKQGAAWKNGKRLW